MSGNTSLFKSGHDIVAYQVSYLISEDVRTVDRASDWLLANLGMDSRRITSINTEIFGLSIILSVLLGNIAKIRNIYNIQEKYIQEKAFSNRESSNGTHVPMLGASRQICAIILYTQLLITRIYMLITMKITIFE